MSLRHLACLIVACLTLQALYTGACCLLKSQQDTCDALNTQVKEDVGLGGANPMVQLAGDYAKLLASKAHLPVVQHSCYPALGLEVVGNMLR